MSRHTGSLARESRPFDILCFQTSGSSRTRAKYNSERRQEVSSVRKQGACLRCRILKIQCSGDNPCKSCLKLARNGLENKVLSFPYCIRTRFRDVNIFTEDISFQQSVAGKLARVANRTPTLDFQLEWDLHGLVEMVLGWLRDPVDSTRSLVGAFSSPHCANLLREHLNDDLVSNFGTMLYATTMAYIEGCQASDREEGGPAGLCTPQDLLLIGHITGRTVVHSLDRLLAPTHLARVSLESLEAIFLLVFGTYLTLGYTQRLGRYQTFPNDDGQPLAEPRRQTLWDAMQEHISAMMAHYILFIGSKLGPDISDFSRGLITSPSSRWKTYGKFTWQASVCLCQEDMWHCLETLISAGPIRSRNQLEVAMSTLTALSVARAFKTTNGMLIDVPQEVLDQHPVLAEHAADPTTLESQVPDPNCAVCSQHMRHRDQYIFGEADMSVRQVTIPVVWASVEAPKLIV